MLGVLTFSRTAQISDVRLQQQLRQPIFSIQRQTRKVAPALHLFFSKVEDLVSKSWSPAKVCRAPAFR